MHRTRIRTFFALELPGEFQEHITKLIERVKPLTQNTIKWTSRENLHITLKFLGTFDPKHTNLIQENMQKELNNSHPFNISLDRFGFFPNSTNPRVIWLGFHHSEEISTIVQVIEKETSSLGYPTENRKFHAHLTLGRIRHNANVKEIDSIKKHIIENKLPKGEIIIKEIVFFHSDLRSTGPVYSRLFTIKL
jgi:2'-5' RNA ligase